jgi:polar amino acid transport system substrate-binding protein
MRRTLIVSLVAASVALAACGDDEAAAPADTATATAPATEAPAVTEAPAATSAADCAAGKTIADGVLTIATGDPAFPPYVINDPTPEDGQGFEAAVAMAVARELGFTGEAVTWTRTAFDAAIAPGPKDFDFNLQQYTITPERAQAVDFSEGYYTAAEAIFGLADSPAANAKTLADLQGLKIGVAAGTTSVTYVEETIKPTAEPLIFNDNAAAKAALEGNQIDAIVSDLPTALYITAVEIEGTKVFGQIEGSGTDEFGLLLAKDSPLTECVNIALDSLKSSGELDQITRTWMADYTEAPVISLG